MAKAGYLPAIMHPKIWVAKLDPITGRGPVWPTRKGVRTTEVTKPAPEWKRWWGHTNGFQVNILDPQANIQTSDRGILTQVSTGAHGVGLASISKTPLREFVEWFNKLAKYTIAPTGGTPEVETLTLAGSTATAAGTAVVVLDGEVYQVPVSASDTPTLVGTALRNPANYTPALTGWTPSGTTTSVIYTATAPGARSGQFSITLPTALTGSFAETTPGLAPTYAGGDTMFFDPNGEYGSTQRFTVFIEGVAPAGSWADQSLLVRLMAHQVNQGGTNALRMDDSGADANTQTQLAGQCEPREVSALELLGTGFATDKQDPYGKMTWWVADQLAA